MGKALVRAAGKDLHLTTERHYSGTAGEDQQYIPVEKTALEVEEHVPWFYSGWRDIKQAIMKPSMTKHFICTAVRKKKKCIRHIPKSTYESHKIAPVGSVRVGARWNTAGKFWALQLKKNMAQTFPKSAAEDQTALSV